MKTDHLREWHFADKEYQLGDFPLLMGIVNVTPDSFSDGGLYRDTEAAVEHALKLADDGADILDIGGESTRPGAAPVALEEELQRTVEVISRLAKQTNVPISIDTMKAEVAQQALDAGATIVNDVSGLTADDGMYPLLANTSAGVIIMHMQGSPETMQQQPHYDDVVGEVCSFLADQLAELEQQGIDRRRVVIDPGIGFGKTAEHNLALLSHIAQLRSSDRPVLIGHSRKRFLKQLLGRSVEERTFGTQGVAVALAMQNVDIIRVHDVMAVRDVLVAWQAITSKIET